MDAIVVTPEKTQRTIWVIQTLLITLLIVGFFMIPYYASQTQSDAAVFGYFNAVFILIALAVLIWIPFYFRSLRYEIDDREIRVSRGVFWKSHVTVPYTKVTNVDVTQGPLERVSGIGRVKVQTAGYGGKSGQKAEQVLLGLRQFNEARNTIMHRIARYEKGIAESAEPGVEAEGTAGTPHAMEALLEEVRAIRELLEAQKNSSN